MRGFFIVVIADKRLFVCKWQKEKELHFAVTP